jgi:hypothetical protein
MPSIYRAFVQGGFIGIPFCIMLCGTVGLAKLLVLDVPHGSIPGFESLF